MKKRRSRKPVKSLLWITDPWNTLDHPHDTTLRLIQEGTEFDLKQYWCDVKSIRLEGSRVLLDAKRVLSVDPERGPTSFEWAPTETRSVVDFSQLHYRTDPPVDLAYLHPLHLLALGLKSSMKNKGSTEIVNPLNVLLSNNEKMEAASLKELMPPSLVSSQWERLLEFGRKHQRTVLKPLHQALSTGIELLDWRKEDSCQYARTQLASATQQFQIPVLLQSYLEGIAYGETRLWFLDGKLLSHVKKLPITGDFRVNIDQGSRIETAPLTKLEKLKVPKIARHLRHLKIRLAAVDLIEGYVTDFNFTSPGLITQMESLLHENLAHPIIDALMKDSNRSD